jgi:kynurenine formamidase
MRVLLAALVFCAACRPVSSSPPLSGGRLIDLSHAYDGQTIFWPTSQPFHLEVVSDGMTDQGFYYAANNFSTSEHGGTHLDAPRHFAEGHQTADQIPLDRLMGSAVVVDVVDACEKDPDYLVATDDFLRWEAVNGLIPSDEIVLIRTGFSRRWPDAARYLGTAERGPDAVATLHFPGLHPDAARWLVEERSVKAVGIDTASIDYGQSARFEAHRLLSAQNIPVFENLTALDQLPATGGYVVALPMKIAGGSGAPLRAVAVVAR